MSTCYMMAVLGGCFSLLQASDHDYLTYAATPVEYAESEELRIEIIDDKVLDR